MNLQKIFNLDFENSKVVDTISKGVFDMYKMREKLEADRIKEQLYDAPSLTKITLDNWRYFGQLEVLSTTGGTLDNWRSSRQLEVFSTTGGTFGQVEVLWTSGGALDSWGYFG